MNMFITIILGTLLSMTFNFHAGPFLAITLVTIFNIIKQWSTKQKERSSL